VSQRGFLAPGLVHDLHRALDRPDEVPVVSVDTHAPLPGVLVAQERDRAARLPDTLDVRAQAARRDPGGAAIDDPGLGDGGQYTRSRSE
jgi:hypothetical protein